MSNFLWVKTSHRQELLDALEKIPEYGKKNKSEILEIALEEFVKKHGKSNNPQSRLSQFHSEGIVAIPSIYEMNDDPIVWKKFYKLIGKKEFKIIDRALNSILNLHNKRDKEFL